MNETVFPPWCLTWGQTMVEVMKIMATSFKMSCGDNATLSAPDPAAGHHWHMPLPETLGHSWASLGQSLVGSLLLSPGSWFAQGFVCALQESFSPFLCNCRLYCGVNGNLPKRAYAIPRSAVLRAPAPVAGRLLVTCTSSGDTQTLKGRSGSYSVGSPGVHKVLFETSEHLWWEGVSF